MLTIEWLQHDCTVGEETLDTSVKNDGAVLQPAFWEAYHLGPSESDLQVKRQSLKQEYDNQNQWLRTEGAKVLDESLARGALAISGQQFVEAGLENYRHQYRDGAITGLGIVCSSDCENELTSIARDQNNPSHAAARLARDRIKQRTVKK